MYPNALSIAGIVLSIWNAMFLVAVFLGWVAFRLAVRGEAELSTPTLRHLVVVYLSALAAQVFAYAFDAHTSLLPPPGHSLWRHYLDPLAGPKTLYGVIVLMPMSVGLATMGCRLSLARALDLWTVPMFVVLAVARIGCFLQGCCHGAPSELFGVSFPPGTPVYSKQHAMGLLAAGASRSTPVVPTQAIEAVTLAFLAFWSWRRRASIRRDGDLFLAAVVWYSVFRFVVEFVRADPERGIYGPLASSQWIALVVFLAAPFLRQGKSFLQREPADVQTACPSAEPW